MRTTRIESQRPADKITPRERKGLARWRNLRVRPSARGPLRRLKPGAARAEVHRQFQSVPKTAADWMRSPVS
jgi:hypothetical protein